MGRGQDRAGGIEPRAAAGGAWRALLGCLLLLGAGAEARASIVVFPFAVSTVAELPACSATYKSVIRGVTDASSSSSLGAGGGSAAALAQCDGTDWGVVSGGGGSGTSITLDLGDDGGNDSTALSEIAVTGDANSIFTESAADKLLIAAGNDWPKADTADDLTCTNCIGGTEIDETALVVGGDGSGSVAALVVADDSHNHGASTLGTDSVSADELNATGVETELEAVLDLDQLQGQIGDAQIADGAVDGGTGGEVADDSLTAADIAADAVGTAELDDDANTAVAGSFVVVETGAASFDYVAAAAGTDITADLEEETHATEHSLGGGDAITATNLAAGCTDAQVLGGTAAGTGVECQADDDVPESGDFGAGVDLEADGSLSADVVGAAELADADLGDVSVSGGVVSVDDEAVAATELTDATDGSILTWDASGEAVLLAPGTSGQVLTTGGAGAAPTWEDAAGGASLTVEEADGSPTVASVDTIQFDSADGFTVTDETGGNVQVDLLFAKLLNLDGDGNAEIGGTSGTNLTFDPGDDGLAAAYFSLSETSDLLTLEVNGSGRLRFENSPGRMFALTQLVGGSGGISYSLVATQASDTAPVLNPEFNDSNTGIGWNTNEDMRLIANGASSLGVTDTEVDLYLIRDDAEQSVTCTDSGDGADSSVSFAPTTSYVKFTNADAQACAATISETGAADGRTFEVVLVSNAGTTVNFTDSSGVQETGAGCSLAIWGSAKFRYVTDRWVMSSCQAVN